MMDVYDMFIITLLIELFIAVLIVFMISVANVFGEMGEDLEQRKRAFIERRINNV